MNDQMFQDGVFKLHADGDIMGRVLKNADMKVNAGKMSATVILTTVDEDRSGDIVIPKGIDLSDHRKNPIALLNHDRNAPIGRFEDKLGNYTVKMRGDKYLVGEVFFNQSSEFAHDVFRAVENKIFTGVSIGFMPKRVEKRNGRGQLYHSSSLVEGSILTIGDNPNAIVEAVNKSLGGGKGYGPELLAILRPLVPAANETVVGGFEATPAETVVEKMYGEDQDDTLLNGGGDDQMMDDGMGGDPNDPNAQQDDSGTEQAWLTIAIDLVQQAMAHDESALKKLGMLLKTRKKLIVGGDDGDMPDISDEEPDGDEGDEEDVDFETPDEGDDEDMDGETDAPGPQGKKKKKKPAVFDKGFVWRDQDEKIITKTYKLLTSILVTPSISREKLDANVRKIMDEMETIEPVERGIVAKSIKTPHKNKPAQHVEPEEDLTALLMALDENDAQRERRNKERDMRLFEIFGR